jgi:hypothetical protein
VGGTGALQGLRLINLFDLFEGAPAAFGGRSGAEEEKEEGIAARAGGGVCVLDFAGLIER